MQERTVLFVNREKAIFSEDISKRWSALSFENNRFDCSLCPEWFLTLNMKLNMTFCFMTNCDNLQIVSRYFSF